MWHICLFSSTKRHFSNTDWKCSSLNVLRASFNNWMTAKKLRLLASYVFPIKRLKYSKKKKKGRKRVSEQHRYQKIVSSVVREGIQSYTWNFDSVPDCFMFQRKKTKPYSRFKPQVCFLESAALKQPTKQYELRKLH